MLAPVFAWAFKNCTPDQRREVDNAPFILHPLEVAALLASRDYEDAVVAAGLLHDAVEKTEATSVADVRERCGEHVAAIVAAVPEDPTIADYGARKAALRDGMAAAGPDAHAVYAADKIAKARELRAQAARDDAWLDDPRLQRRSSTTSSLAVLREVAGELWDGSISSPVRAVDAARAAAGLGVDADRHRARVAAALAGQRAQRALARRAIDAVRAVGRVGLAARAVEPAA